MLRAADGSRSGELAGMKQFYHGDQHKLVNWESRAENRLQYIASYLVTTHSPPLFSVVTVKSSL